MKIISNKTHKIVAYDLDGVIRDWDSSVKRRYLKDFPEHKEQIKGLPLEWNIDTFYPIGKDIYEYVFKTHANEIYTKAEPYAGAIKFLRDLKELTDKKGFELAILTSQPTQQILDLTLQWIQYYRLPYDSVYAPMNTKAKVMVDLLIDDGQHHLEAVSSTGARAICFDQPWNQNWKGERITTYEEFLDIVRKMR